MLHCPAIQTKKAVIITAFFVWLPQNVYFFLAATIFAN